MLTALLIGGEAHGLTCRAPNHREIWVTMATGEPRLPPDPRASGAYELLVQSCGQWESYLRVGDKARAERGTITYYCSRVLADRQGVERQMPMLQPPVSPAVPPGRNASDR